MPAFGRLPKFLRTRKRRAKARASLRRVRVGGKVYTVRPATPKRRRGP